jgi:hypothetical protein
VANKTSLGLKVRSATGSLLVSLSPMAKNPLSDAAIMMLWEFDNDEMYRHGRLVNLDGMA